MTDSMGPGKLVRHMQNLSYTYDKYLICIGLGPSILSVICKNLSNSGPSYPSSPVQVLCSKALSRTASCLSQLPGFRIPARACKKVASDLGLGPNHFFFLSLGSTVSSTTPRKKGSFIKTSACPRFCKRRVLFCTQVRSMGVKIPL